MRHCGWLASEQFRTGTFVPFSAVSIYVSSLANLLTL